MIKIIIIIMMIIIIIRVITIIIELIILTVELVIIKDQMEWFKLLGWEIFALPSWLDITRTASGCLILLALG